MSLCHKRRTVTRPVNLATPRVASIEGIFNELELPVNSDSEAGDEGLGARLVDRDGATGWGRTPSCCSSGLTPSKIGATLVDKCMDMLDLAGWPCDPSYSNSKAAWLLDRRRGE